MTPLQYRLAGTPKTVMEAINIIAAHLRECEYAQVIIMAEGGAAFRLTDIYEQVLGKQTVRAIKQAGKRAVRTRKAAKR